MISLERMRSRIVSCIAERGGKLSKTEIIQNTTGAKARLIRTIDDLVASGIIGREGKGTRGSPHIFTLIETFRTVCSDDDDRCITVTI